ncbi:TPA: hypothetical protein U5D48_004262 [Yersinia enterocolitica]|nr:hypothetical protein [Yersinia enterocolitica]
MSLSMDAGELKALKQHISLLESSASTELLSLREQLAEQREPVVPSTIKISEVVAAVSLEQNRKWNGRVGYMAGWNACRDAILFTAAKPKALPRHIFSMLVNELRDVPAIGCKRELIVGVLNRHGVIAEPVGD